MKEILPGISNIQKGAIWRNGLDILLVSCQVLFNLQIQIFNKSSVLLVDDYVRDHQAKESKEDQRKSKSNNLETVMVMEKWISAEHDDSENAENDAQIIENDPHLPRLGTFLWILAWWS